MLLVSATTTAMAQNKTQAEYIANSRDFSADLVDESLDGDRGLLIISPRKNLIVNITNNSMPVRQETEDNANGLYYYKIVLDAADTHKANVYVSRMTDVYSTEFVATLKPNIYTAYRITETENPIRYEDNTQGNDVYLNATEAELLFTTAINNLTVKPSDKLGARITTTKDPIDPTRTVISVVFPVAKLEAVRKACKDATDEFNRLNSLINNDKATDADYDASETAEEEMNKTTAELVELTTVMVYTDKSNRLSINFDSDGEVGARTKKNYLVMPVVVEKTVFVTECSRHMADGAKFFEQRRYADARAEYVSAISMKDVDPNRRPAIQECINRCDSCLQYTSLAGKAIMKLMEMKKNNTATQDAAYRYASAAIDFLSVVNSYNRSDFYTSRIEKLEQFIKELPLKVSFTIVEWRTLNEGSTLPDVEIWAYYGQEPMQTVTFSSAKKFKKEIERHSEAYAQIGLTDASGKAEAEIDRNHLPKAFVFCPSNDSGIKITRMSYDDFLKRSVGDYKMKQLRVKMYKRTNKYF